MASLQHGFYHYYYYVLAGVVATSGCYREISGMLRGERRPAFHLSRSLAYLMAASFLAMAPKFDAQSNPPKWALVVQAILILGAVPLFLATRRNTPYQPGKHAGSQK